jgi:hypothetical protein
VNGVNAGYTAARERKRGCIAVGTSRRLAAEGLSGLAGNAVFKFAVLPDGSTTEPHAPRAMPPEVLAAMEAALAECSFEPGRDDRGNPVKMWVIVPLVFMQ